LIRGIFLKIAEDLEPEAFHQVTNTDLGDPRLVQLLRSHFDGRHAKLSGHMSEPQSAPQPAQSNGLRNAKAKGKQLGRPRVDVDRSEIESICWGHFLFL